MSEVGEEVEPALPQRKKTLLELELSCQSLIARATMSDGSIAKEAWCLITAEQVRDLMQLADVIQWLERKQMGGKR